MIFVYTSQNLSQEGSEGHVAPSPKCARPRCLCTTVIVAIAQTPTATHATSISVRVNLRGRRCSHPSAAPRSMESYAVIVATRRRMTHADAIVTGKSGFRLALHTLRPNTATRRRAGNPHCTWAVVVRQEYRFDAWVTARDGSSSISSAGHTEFLLSHSPFPIHWNP